jgi:uncharacterized membrane protein
MKIGAAIKRIFKRYLIAGTLVTVPLIGTYLIIKFIIVSIDDLFMSMVPGKFQPEALIGHHIPGLGLVLTIVIILVVGFFARLYVGNKAIQLGDLIMSKIPLGRSIYGGIKQILTSVFTDSGDKFRSVVLVEYPRKQCWVIGFVTGDPIKKMQTVDERHLINVFVPTTPNPTSGFLIMVPQNEVKRIDISIDNAFKLLISGGIIQDNDVKQT